MLNIRGVSDRRWHDSLTMHYKTKKLAAPLYFDGCLLHNIEGVSSRQKKSPFGLPQLGLNSTKNSMVILTTDRLSAKKDTKVQLSTT